MQTGNAIDMQLLHCSPSPPQHMNTRTHTYAHAPANMNVYTNAREYQEQGDVLQELGDNMQISCILVILEGDGKIYEEEFINMGGELLYSYVSGQVNVVIS